MSMFYELMMKKKGMPSRYQEVEYIESTGTQYIDTGYVPNNNTTIEYKGGKLDSAGAVFGARYSDSIRYFIGSSSGKVAFVYNNTTIPSTISTGEMVEGKITPTAFEINGSLVGSYILNTNLNLSIYLCSINNNGTASSFSNSKFYCFKVSENGSLKKNFIPVYDTETNKYGMWESVQGKFYGNDGTGDFKGSIVGYTIVGSPTITDGVVSGFSASNYLQLPSKPDYNENFEMQVEFTKTATGNCGLCIGGTYTYGGLMVSNNTVRFAIRLDDGTSNTYTLVSNNTIEINALYIANVKRVGNKIVLKIYKNGTLDEEIGEDLTNIAFSTNIGNLRLGVRVGGDALSGSMNLNNTYIKINNKLWFNGQQA